MVLNAFKKRVINILTLGVGGWIIALTAISIINKYLPEDNVWVKLVLAAILIWIGVSNGE